MTLQERFSTDRSFALALQLSAILVGLLIVLLVVEYNRLTTSVFEEAERRGEFLFTTMSYQVSDSLYFNDVEQIRKDAEILTAQDQVRRIAVFSENGQYLLDSSQEKIPVGSIEPAMLELAKTTTGPLNRWQEDHLEFVGAINFDGELMGGLYYEMDVTDQLFHARQDLIELFVLGVLIVVMASGLSFAVARAAGVSRTLRTIESNFQALIEQSPLANSVYSTDGELSYVNPAFEKMMRANPTTRKTLSRGYNIFKDKLLEDADVMTLVEEGFQEGPIEIPMFCYGDEASADPLWLKAVVFPLRDERAETSEVVVVYEDVSAEKKAEEERAELDAQILQSQKLEGLGVMARGLAHDFNNLLTPVQGNADLVARGLPQNSRLQSYVRSIVQASKRAADLCNQLMAYAGSGVQTKLPTDVSQEVADLHELFRSSISKKTVLTESLSPGLPLIMSDQTQLRQIILNLLINASEALQGESGEVTLKTGRATLTEDEVQKLLPTVDRPAGEYVYIEVSDTGVGMNEETKQNLFNPFFSTKFTGRGLGMSAVLGIVQNHSGGIYVESELGKGTTFKVFFPATDMAAMGLSQPEVFPGISLTGRVLLLDDEKEVLEVGRQVLETLGFEVLIASNGVEGMRIFEAHHQSLFCVILDVLMPVLDGEDTLRAIRDLDADMPVIVVSGFTAGENIERLLKDPNVTLLSKPYEIEDLERALAQAKRVEATS